MGKRFVELKEKGGGHGLQPIELGKESFMAKVVESLILTKDIIFC